MNNERGTALVFATLMIVLLLIMVGMGLDTGQLTYSRNTGQGAVDAAALSAVTALPTRDDNLVKGRAKAFTENTFTGSTGNPITDGDVSYVNYDFATQTLTYGSPIGTANGVRVAHTTKSPTFLTPLFNLLGVSQSMAQDVKVSAVSVVNSVPTIPIAIWDNQCGTTGQENERILKVQHPNKKDDDGSENACWTTFLDCSSGGRDIRDLFTAGAKCSGVTGYQVEIDTKICQNRGQVNTSLQTADDFFMKDNTNSWWLVPVIKGGNNCDPENPTKVVNWAKIYPTEVDYTGNPKFIKAKVVCDPDLRKSIIPTNLCFSHRLVREKVKNM